MSLPEWLTEPAPAVPHITRGRRSWVTKSINRLAVLASSGLRGRERPWTVDPRASLIGFAGLIVCTTFFQSPAVLGTACAVGVLLSRIAGASWKMLVVAVLAVGGFTGLAMLPAITSLVTDGDTVVCIGGLAITAQGIEAASAVTLRAVACAILGAGIFVSARPEDIFSSLRWFRVPGVFVAVLLMTYRYLQVIARVALESHVARRSRIVEGGGLSSAREWIGSRIGFAFARSRELAEEVHMAMIARGFDGEFVAPAFPRLSIGDLFWLLLCSFAAGLIIAVDWWI